MKITLCGSTAFINEMETLANNLRALGHKVQFPPVQVPGPNGTLIPTLDYYKQKKTMAAEVKAWIWQKHSQRIRDHFNKVAWSDAILIANYDKDNIRGYIGPNTLMEMGLAFYLNKPIFLLNPLPDILYKEEIVGMEPQILDGDLNKLRSN